MTTLQKLVQTCATDENTLLSLARTHAADWERWLMPISGDAVAGEDPGYDDDFQIIREEVNKLSGIDTGLICQLAEKLLTSVCKDLRVVTFYIWARLHQDGERGLAEGLELLAAMLARFGTQLHPQRDRSRKSALEWLGSSRVTDSLSLYPEVDMSVMQRITGALLLSKQTLLTEGDDISLECTSVPLTDLLVDSRAFEIPGIQLHYEKRTIKFTPLFLYGQDVTGCVEVSLCADGRLIPLSRLFMRSGKSTDWTYTLSGGSSWSRCDFGEEAFFMMLDGLLSD